MKEKLLELWNKAVATVQENKETVIRVGGVVAGIVIGAAVTTLINSAGDEDELEELRLLAEEEDVDVIEETE